MILLTLSIAGSFSFLFIWIICRLCQKSLSHRFRYYIMIIPLLSFLIPVMPLFTISVQTNNYNISQPADISQTASVRHEETGSNTQASEVISAQNAADDERGSQASTPPSPIHIPVKKIILGIWLTTAICIELKQAVSKRRFIRNLRKCSYYPPGEFSAVLAEECGLIGIKRIPKLTFIDGNISPFIIGIIRPEIVLPSDITPAHLKCVLRHELTHLKRHDLLFKRLSHLVTVIHWFNPVSYLFRGYAERQMEFSCDESVASTLDKMQKYEYSKSILTLAQAESHNYSAALSESAINIKHRMEVIMMTKHNSSKILSLILATAMIFITTAASASMTASVSEKSGSGIYKISDTASAYINSDIEEDITDQTIPCGKCKGERTVTLINTPFYKSFYAEISSNAFYKRYYVPEQDDTTGKIYNITKYDTDNPVNAVIQIKMDSLIRTTSNEKNWYGTFSVSVNGQTILDNVEGFLNDIPGKQTDMSNLYLFPDDNTNVEFSMSLMNFNLTGDTAVNSSYKSYQLKNDLKNAPDYAQTNAVKPMSLNIGEKQLTASDRKLYFTEGSGIQYSRATGKMIFNSCVDNYYILSDIENTYSFTDDTASGTFYIAFDYMYSIIDDFEGTITNYSAAPGSDVVIQSNDGKYVFRAKASNDPPLDFDPYADNTYFGGSDLLNPENQPHDADYFVHEAYKEANRPSTLADFPFDIKLSDDKTSVTLTRKQDRQFEKWLMTMATYNYFPNDWNIWEERYSIDNNDVVTYPVYNNGCRHYINFSGFNTQTGAEKMDYEIQFFINNGELVYTQVLKSHLINDNYKNEAAAEKLSQFYYNYKQILQKENSMQ